MSQSFRNDERAERVIKFIEKLYVPSGILANKRFTLLPFQKQFIRDIYAPAKPDGNRLVSQAILSVARKNGKSALISALVLAHLFGPESEPFGEIYSAANSREQAGIIFKQVHQLILAHPELRNMTLGVRPALKVVESSKLIQCSGNGSFYKAISREAGAAHGLNPSVWIYDELAQSASSDLYDALVTSQAARKEPLGVVISTQNPDPEHILSRLIDDGLNANDPRIVCHLYEVPMSAPDIHDQSVWKQANPAIGEFLSFDSMRALSDHAKRDVQREAAFRNLHLNQRISVDAPLISASDWTNCGKKEYKLEEKEEIYLGLDLAKSADLAALVAVSANSGDRIKCWAWTHSYNLDYREKVDGSPYTKWYKEGHIFITKSNAISFDEIARFIRSLTKKYTIKKVAYDRWRIDDFERAWNESFEEDEERIAFFKNPDPIHMNNPGVVSFLPFGQGYVSMTPAIEALTESVREGTLLHDNNPVLTRCISNAIPIYDPAGNVKLDKRRRNMRIDAAIALAMAIGVKSKDATVNYPDYSVWAKKDNRV